MTGTHRRRPHRSTACRASAAAAAVVTAAGLTAAVTDAVRPKAAGVQLELSALVTPANSTAQVFASSDYYGIDWVRLYGPPQVVPFFLGPPGIAAAIDRNAADPDGVVVLASGWGAGQTGTALSQMQRSGDPALDNVRLMVLDNNTNRAGGGFWTSYPWLAPLLLTSAAPTPDDTAVPVVDTAYEYNINSDAPTYPINAVAELNSLMAYVYDYGGQARAPMPAEALAPVAPDGQHYHYVVAPDGTIAARYPVDGTITYVTFSSDGLPLLRPLRALPGGDVVADAVEPVATALVDAGYQDGAPIPVDPGIPRPAGLLPPAQSFSSASSRALVDRPSAATSASIVGSSVGTVDVIGRSPTGVDSSGRSQRKAPTQPGTLIRRLRASMPRTNASPQRSTLVVSPKGLGSFPSI